MYLYQECLNDLSLRGNNTAIRTVSNMHNFPSTSDDYIAVHLNQALVLQLKGEGLEFSLEDNSHILKIVLISVLLTIRCCVAFSGYNRVAICRLACIYDFNAVHNT